MLLMSYATTISERTSRPGGGAAYAVEQLLNDPSVATKPWHMACVLKAWAVELGEPMRGGAAGGGLENLGSDDEWTAGANFFSRRAVLTV